MKRTVLLLAVIFACLSSRVTAEELPVCGKIFVELKFSYSHRQPKWFGPDYWDFRHSSLFQSGSFWCIKTKEPSMPSVIVSASHVLGLNRPLISVIDSMSVDNVNVIIKHLQGRALMGVFAYPLAEIGRVGDAPDAVFLRPQNQQLYKTLCHVELAEAPPKRGEKVKIVGFPGTAHEQFKEGFVTDTQEGRGYFVLNEAVDKGYSGGVVLNNEGNAYGVITSTDPAEKQTTVYRITPAMISKIEWKPAAPALNHEF